jgi:hypothetical protein
MLRLQQWPYGLNDDIFGASKTIPVRLMLSPLSNRHRQLTSQLVETSSHVRQRGLDHQVRLAVSLAALVGTLMLALLSTPAPELPSMQAVDVPALKAKS